MHLFNRFSSIALGLILGISNLAAPAASPAQGNGAPDLPFRATREGKVNFKDLLKLTKQAPARDRISDEELEGIKKEHEIEYGKGFIATEAPAMPPRNDLYASSTILFDGVNHTLIPKQALLFVPESQKEHIIENPKGELILWPNFVRRHRNWVKSHEVTLETAKGEDPISPLQREAFQLADVIVVSVFRGNPISVLPPKEPAADQEIGSLPLTMKADDDEAAAGTPAATTNVSSSESGATASADHSRFQRFTRAQAAESLAQVQDEAVSMAEKAQEEDEEEKPSASRTAAPTRQSSLYRDRTKSRFGRLVR